jgi:hypothetical protein
MSDLMTIVQEIEKLLAECSLEEKRFIMNHLNINLKLEENDKE